ncbi:MAG: exo-alpha-sialidase [Ruminococcaceae bacterium]|nr:exo-alpha-sialidase [Oscillospiraceae bacterium]
MKTVIVRDLPPTADNNRNSEGAFLQRRDGSILFAYSRYRAKGASDGAEADLYGMVSHDGGRSFGEPFPILTHEQAGGENVMSVSLLRMAKGDMGLFFLRKSGGDQCLPFLMRSSDEGASWNEPLLCGEEKGYFVVNNDRVIRTRQGRILIPAALHEGVWGAGVFYLFASDDDGKSFYTLFHGSTIPRSRGSRVGIQEPGLLELADGRLWCYVRTDTGRQYEAFSDDGGVSFTDFAPSAFTSPVSPLSVKRLSDGRLLAVWNPIPLYNGRSERIDGVWTGARTPLVMAFSEDDGESFSSPIPIETDEKSGFCYTAIHETDDGAILLGYCAGSVADGSTLNRLRLRRLEKEEKQTPTAHP